jgi:hypothetical protein
VHFASNYAVFWPITIVSNGTFIRSYSYQTRVTGASIRRMRFLVAAST